MYNSIEVFIVKKEILISPTVDQSLSTTIATLKWNVTDPDTIDLLKYDVYCDTQNPPIQKVSPDDSLKEVSLSVNGASTYFWKVVVKDDKGGITIGQIWSFKTK